MAVTKGTVDYARLLKGLPAGTRQTLYKQLIDGREGQAGIAEQYVNALVEFRSNAEVLEGRRAFVESEDLGKLPEEIQKQAREEYATFIWVQEKRRQTLDALAAELERLQVALGELDAAGTTST